jgi:hypothetical protein
VLFARVDAIGQRMRGLVWLFVAALVFMLLCIAFVHRSQASSIKWQAAAARVAAKPFDVAFTPARVVMPFSATAPMVTPEQFAQLSEPQAVATWLTGQLETVKAGKSLEGCKDLKINAAWPTDAIGCRLSADHTRLWVWGLTRITNTNGAQQLQPVFVVYRKAEWVEGAKADWQLRSVDVSNVVPLPGLERVRWDAIPRAAGDDFAELSR